MKTWGKFPVSTIQLLSEMKGKIYSEYNSIYIRKVGRNWDRISLALFSALMDWLY